MAIARNIFGAVNFSLAAWFIFEDIMILWTIFSFRHNYDSPPYFFILHFAGVYFFEGWQVRGLVIILALAAILFIRLGIQAFSSKKVVGN
jgi:hypothetical protein